jgi:hypothetical protein
MRKVTMIALGGLMLLVLGSACNEVPVEPPAEPELPDFVHAQAWYDEGEWVYEYDPEIDFWNCWHVRPDGRQEPFQCGRIFVGIQPDVADEELDDLWEKMGMKDAPTFHLDPPWRHARGWVPMRHEPTALRIADEDPRTRYATLNWVGGIFW